MQSVKMFFIIFIGKPEKTFVGSGPGVILVTVNCRNDETVIKGISYF